MLWTTSLTNLNPIICSYRLLLTMRDNSKMSLLDRWIQWTTLKSFNYLVFIKMQHIMGCLAPNMSQDNIRPYILGNKGYLLLPWLRILHKQNANVQHILLEAFYNRQLSRGRNVVENAFGILKKTFKKLLLKSNLHITFLPNVNIFLCMLYNLILDGGEANINTLMDQLEQENQTHEQGVVRRHDNTIVNMWWNIEANIVLEGDEFFGYEQTKNIISWVFDRT